MRYVALLRGINVGGNAVVAMKRLKRMFEDLGCLEVSTFINSGNVLFLDKRTAAELAPVIERAILDTFGFTVPTILRSQSNLEKLCQAIPQTWTNDGDQKTDVLFLWDAIDSPEITKRIVTNPELERVKYLPGALVWNIDRANATRGSSVKLIKSDLYKSVTVRNISTVRKLNALLQKTDEAHHS